MSNCFQNIRLDRARFFFFRFSVLKLFDFLFYILDIGIIGFLSSLIYFGVKYLQQQNLSEDGFVDKYWILIKFGPSVCRRNEAHTQQRNAVRVDDVSWARSVKSLMRCDPGNGLRTRVFATFNCLLCVFVWFCFHWMKKM